MGRTVAMGFAIAWVIVALAATWGLGWIGAVAGRWPEGVHLVGHLGLCAVLAAVVALAGSGSPGLRAARGLGAALLFGLAIEGLQLRHSPPWPEVVLDLVLDLIGALIGLGLWSTADTGRAEPVGHLISAVLHPVVVAPMGFGIAVLAGPDPVGLADGLSWLGLAALCLTPALIFWGLGIQASWWSDADLSRRTDRAPLFVVGCVGALCFVLCTLDAPAPVQRLAQTAGVGAILGTVATTAGLKISGHVAIPAALGLVVLPWTDRGAGLLLGMALVLSWARVSAGRHQPLEVAAGWGLAAMLSSPVAAALADTWS